MTDTANILRTGRHTALGRGPEFDAITHLVERLGTRATGIGDDAAMARVPRGDLLVASVDALIEGRHFERTWITPREIGYRATVAAMSDLAAMAAWPIGILAALAVPEGWRPALDDITDGIADAVSAADMFVLGGNMSAASQLSITTTVLGHAFRPTQRSSGSLGDLVYVTGLLGGPSMAVAAWKRGEPPDPHHRDRFARPRPRLAEARWLTERGATAMIDISDGLIADLGHLAAASGLIAEIDLNCVPAIGGASPVEAARSGEEYELIVTSPRELSVADFEASFGLRLTRIGQMRGGPAEVIVTSGGLRVDLAGGFDHFGS